MPDRKISFVLIGFALLLTAILLTPLFPKSGIFHSLSYSLSRSTEAALDDLDDITIALGRYHSSTRTFPTTEQGLSALVQRPAAAPVAWTKTLDAVPLDPWNRPYVYKLLDTPNEEDRHLILYSLGPDGEPSADDVDSGINL